MRSSSWPPARCRDPSCRSSLEPPHFYSLGRFEGDLIAVDGSRNARPIRQRLPFLALPVRASATRQTISNSICARGMRRVGRRVVLRRDLDHVAADDVEALRRRAQEPALRASSGRRSPAYRCQARTRDRDCRRRTTHRSGPCRPRSLISVRLHRGPAPSISSAWMTVMPLS